MARSRLEGYGSQRRLRSGSALFLLIALASGGLVIAGSLGPWATVAGEVYAGGEVDRFQVDGLIGDGMFTLALSAGTVLLVLWRILRGRASGFLTGLAVVLLVLSAVVGMLNWVDISNMPGVYEPGKYYHTDARPAWGLLATTFAAALGAVALAYQLWSDELR